MQVNYSVVAERIETLPATVTNIRLPTARGRQDSRPPDGRQRAWWEDRRRAYLVAKRTLDVSAAMLAVLVMLPVLLVIALAVWLESPGAVLFRQPRIGWQGRLFTMLKFRTMKADRRVRDLPFEGLDRRTALKSGGDPRITRLGRFLRRTSLDELPQLLNVIRGEMSLVGPRPEQVEMLRYYRPWHFRRHQAVPGLTGWWQVNGRCNRMDGTDPEADLAQKLADDEEYIRRRSFWFDLKIILRTVPVVLGQRGAL